MANRPLPPPTCPQGYTLKDLMVHFKLVPGQDNPIWDIVHANEAKCKCSEVEKDEDGGKRGHGVVHPIEAFKNVRR